MTAAVYQVGEPVVVLWVPTQGDPSTLSQQKAVVRKALPRSGGIDPTSTDLTNFSFTWRAATSKLAAGWTATLTGSQTAALGPGDYAVNFAFGSGGVVYEISKTLFFKLEASTTTTVT